MTTPPATTATVGSDAWLSSFATITRAVVLETWQARSCVASTRVGIDVLKAFGVLARPRPVVMHAYSADAYAWHRAHPDQHVGAPVGHSVGVVGTGAVHGGNWNGHLVMTLPRRHRFVDLSIDQASRPDKGMPIDGPIVAALPDDWWVGDPTRWVIHETDHGVVIMYQAMTGDGSTAYRGGPDWAPGRAAMRRAAVAEAIHRIRAA